MKINIKICVLYLGLILIIPSCAAYSGSEAGYEVKLLTPNEYSDTSLENPYLMNFNVNPGVSGLLRTEGNFRIGLNIYPGGVGGEYDEQGYKLYLVPEQAFISYSYGITANDPDGTIVSYAWEFGDGDTGSGGAPNHSYASYRWNGSAYQPFMVNLTVEDNSGLTNRTSQNVIIWITGDANGDGAVNILDASVVGLKWGKTP